MNNSETKTLKSLKGLEESRIKILMNTVCVCVCERERERERESCHFLLCKDARNQNFGGRFIEPIKLKGLLVVLCTQTKTTVPILLILLVRVCQSFNEVGKVEYIFFLCWVSSICHCSYYILLFGSITCTSISLTRWETLVSREIGNFFIFLAKGQNLGTP